MPDFDWVLPAMQRHGGVSGTCSFIGGSYARGWANPGSDVDVYVLGGTKDSVWAVVGAPEGRPNIDVHEMSDDTVERLYSRISWDTVRSGKNYVRTLTSREWLLLERLYHAHVLTGAEVVAEYCDRLRHSAHRHMLVQEHFTTADAYAEDCLGQLAIDDLDSAVLSGQSAFLRTVDGLLSARGCFVWNPKWRPRAMQEANPDLVSYGTYWAVVTMADLPAMGRRAWALRCVESARDLMSRVDVLRFEANP